MKQNLATIYGILLALFMLFLLYQYIFERNNLPELARLFG